MASSDYIEKDLGLVTAYGEAVAGGYRGTREDFQRLIARMANSYLTYNDLNDKPKINGVELIGNKTDEDLNISSNMHFDEEILDLSDYMDTNQSQYCFYGELRKGNGLFYIKVSWAVSQGTTPPNWCRAVFRKTDGFFKGYNGLAITRLIEETAYLGLGNNKNKVLYPRTDIQWSGSSATIIEVNAYPLAGDDRPSTTDNGIVYTLNAFGCMDRGIT